MPVDTISKRSATAIGAVAGLVAAIVALGVAELVAALRREWKGPILDVGDRVIDRVPVFLKDFAIETFGTNDKPALLIGIGAFLAIYAAVIGALAFRRNIWIGVIGIAAFGLIGAYAALTRRVGGSFSDITPSIIGAAVGAGALYLTYRVIQPVLPERSQVPGTSDRARFGRRRADQRRRRPPHRSARRDVRCWCDRAGCSRCWHLPERVPAPWAGP